MCYLLRFSLAAFGILCLYLIFIILITMCFGCMQHCASWTLITVSFPRLGSFSAIISCLEPVLPLFSFWCPYSVKKQQKDTAINVYCKTGQQEFMLNRDGKNQETPLTEPSDESCGQREKIFLINESIVLTILWKQWLETTVQESSPNKVVSVFTATEDQGILYIQLVIHTSQFFPLFLISPFLSITTAMNG